MAGRSQPRSKTQNMRKRNNTKRSCLTTGSLRMARIDLSCQVSIVAARRKSRDWNKSPQIPKQCGAVQKPLLSTHNLWILYWDGLVARVSMIFLFAGGYCSHPSEQRLQYSKCACSTCRIQACEIICGPWCHVCMYYSRITPKIPMTRIDSDNILLKNGSGWWIDSWKCLVDH